MLQELSMKYAILLIASIASVAPTTLVIGQSFDQANSMKIDQEQTDDKLNSFSPTTRQSKYSSLSSPNGLFYGKFPQGPPMSADAILGMLGKRASTYTMGTDMISGMNPIGKRAPSMGTDMITGMMPIGKRAYAVGTDMISGMMPIGKRFEFINMKPILYQRHYSGYAPIYTDLRWSDYDADQTASD